MERTNKMGKNKSKRKEVTRYQKFQSIMKKLDNQIKIEEAERAKKSRSKKKVDEDD